MFSRCPTLHLALFIEQSQVDEVHGPRHCLTDSPTQCEPAKMKSITQQRGKLNDKNPQNSQTHKRRENRLRI